MQAGFNKPELTRPLKWTRLLVPEASDISLEAGEIVKRDRRSYASYREVPAPKDLLVKFVALRDQPEQAFLRFARRWGYLALCHHALPASHYWDCPISLREPVEAWRALSEQAYAILNLRDALNRKQPRSDADWSLALTLAADCWFMWARQRRSGRDPRRYRNFAHKELGHCVQAWLSAAHIGPHIVWDAGQGIYQLPLGPSDKETALFAHLAMQLMLAVADIERLALCSGCGKGYRPEKRPAESRRSFCTQCGKRAATRLAVRGFRERQKLKLRKGKAK